MSKKRTTSRREAADPHPIGEDTPPAAECPRANLHREKRLPLYSIGSVALEEICLDILRYDYPQIKRKALKRSSGQRQFGVDVEGFNA
jgi:hypothetical protein